jgi:hypothetical protein
MNEVFYPYYKKGDCEKAGFIKLNKALEAFPAYRLTVYYRIIMPLWATAYLFLVLIFDYLYHPNLIIEQHYIYYMTGVWALVMLQTGKTIQMALLSVIPFLIGFLIFRSVYVGYIAVVVLLSIFFAYSFDDNIAFETLLRRLQSKSGRSLAGKKLNIFRRIHSFLRYGFLALTPFFMLITIIAIMYNSEFSRNHVIIKYLPSPIDNLFLAFPLILVYTNISITVFGGIFSYLQNDFFTELAKRIRFKKENPRDFKKQELMINEKKSNNSTKSLPINPTDRMLPLNHAHIHNFRVALTFFSVDALLTIASTLGIAILPGVDLDKIATLSSLIKIPVYVVCIIRSLNRFPILMNIKVKVPFESATYTEEQKRETDLYTGLEQLFLRIQEQQMLHKDYVDLHGNHYLSYLSGSTNMEKRKYL